MNSAIKSDQRLPPELWFQILELVCRIPGELNAEAASLFERPSHQDVFHSRLELLPIRRQLPLVCRAFYNLANRLLYASVSIPRQAILDRLIDTLESAASRDPEEMAPPAGKWIRRLDIDFRRQRHWHGFYFEKLSRLLCHTPKLEIFVVFGEFDRIRPSSDAWAFIFRSCAKNLKVISLPHIYRDAPRDDSSPLVKRDQVTKVLRDYTASNWWKWNLATQDWPYSFDDPSNLQNIRVIQLTEAWTGQAAHDRSYFPRLSTIQQADSINYGFLRVHGFKIRVLELNSAPWSRISRCFNHLPNLQKLIIEISIIHRHSYWIVQNPDKTSPVCGTVQVVGLTLNGQPLTRSSYASIFEALPVMIPNLRSVRMLELLLVELISEAIQKSPRWHTILKEQSIRIEREDGELLG